MTNVQNHRGRHTALRTPSIFMLALASTTLAAGCDLGKVTVNTTSKVLARAQPSMKMESDYELASRALPSTLKTVEGFWVVDPENERLRAILAEGYCQYGSGFVEDEFERADFAQKFDEAEYHAARATKMFVRCMNYSLMMIGDGWDEKIFGETETVQKLIASAGKGKRDGMMWLGIGLASAINYNKDSMAMVAQLPTAVALLEKVVELDEKHGYPDEMKRALPHVALGMFYSAQAPALGGKPEEAKKHFERALEITDGKMLLARTYMARRLGVGLQDKEFFRKHLIEVLRTPPSIWPEQRLANEIAHRRARRYLNMEKEWF